MKFKGTWVFTLVVIVAVAAAIWDYRTQESKKSAEEKAAYLLQDFKMSDVANFEFAGNAGTFKAENKNGEWHILEPIQDKADYESLEGLLLGLAEQGMAELELPVDVNWDQYGLDKPEATLSLNMQDGSTVKVEVGSERAYNNGFYVRKNGENKLFLGTTSWASYLSKTANDMRNRDLYSGSADHNFMEIRHGQDKLRFEMQDGKWISFDRPNVLIDESAIYDYMNIVKHMRADAVVSDVASSGALKLYNLNRPAFSVSLEERSESDNKKWKIIFSKDKNSEVFVSIGSENPVYRIQARKMDSLKKNFSHFRDKAYPFAFRQPNVPGFRIRRAVDKKEYTFQKKSSGWMLAVEAPHMKINETAIDNMFNGLRGLKVKEFLKPKAAKEKVKAKYGLVLLNALGDPTFEMYWGEEEKVNEDARVKVWTSIAEESFWVDATEFKKFEARNLLVPDMEGQESKEEEK